MASGAIKGITIKLGADASELTTALHNTESALNSTRRQLRDVDTALKFNPGNIELLKQKFTLLQREIEDNKKYIADLKEALQKMRDAGVDETSDEFMTLQRAIIQAENKAEQFDRELEQTKTALNNAKSGTDNLERGLNSIDASKAKSELTTLKVAMGNLVAQGISRLTNAIGNNLSAAVARSDTLANFPKVMQGMGIAAGDAQTAVDKLADGIQGLPTTLDDATNGVKQFTAANGDVNKSTDYFLALNNAIVAGGASADIQATAMEQLSQAYAKGKPDVQEWQALQTAMPAQLQQVAKSMGMTSAELGEGLRNGTISMDEFMGQIVKLNNEGGKGFKSFTDQAKDATGGIGTMMTNLGNAITRGLQQAIDSFGRENLTGLIQTITNAVNTAMGVLGTIFGFVGQHATAFSVLAAGIGAVVGAITVWSAVTKIMAAVQTALNIVLAANPIGIVILAIVGLVAAIVVAYKKSETFRNIVHKVGALLKGAFAAALRLVKTAFDRLKSAVNAVRSVLSGAFKKAVNVAKSAIDAAKNAINAIKDAFSRLIDKIKSVAKAIKGTLKKAFDGLASIGMDIVKGLWSGLSSGLGWIKSMIRGWVGNVKDFLKSLFGIHSPSTWARDTIGYNIVAGMAKGISGNADLVNAAMQGLMPNISPPAMSFTANAKPLTSTDVAYGTQAGMNSMIKPMAEAFAAAMEGMGIRVDSREFGRVIRGAI